MQDISSYHFEKVIPVYFHCPYPVITISTHTISFNAACQKVANLAVMKGMEVYFDNQNKVIGLHPVHINSPSSFFLTGRKKPTGACKLNAAKFIEIKLFPFIGNILNEYSLPLPAIWDEKGKMFIIDLKQASCSAPIAKAKKRGRKPKIKEEDDQE